MFKRKPKKRWIVLLALLAALLTGFAAWKIVRACASVSCTPWTGQPVTAYTEQNKVLTAVSLSCLCYGCETCDAPCGTVSELLDREQMGIITENADITRTDRDDPSTALIDSGAFIRRMTGGFRFVTELRDENSSFYGACFADDANKVLWLAYAGSVSFKDAVQSVKLAVGAGLSGQEEHAFALYEQALHTEEIKNRGYGLLLTGHSLGGGLASMVSRMSGCEAVTVSGADGLALRKINDIAGGEPAEYRISNYLTSPKNGEFSFKDLVQRMMFWGDYGAVENHVYRDNGMVENAHCIFGFVEFRDGEPVLPSEETDW